MRQIFKMIMVFVLMMTGGTARAQVYIALSFDDPQLSESPLLSWQQRNEKILAGLKKHRLQSVLYVCGKRVQTPEGQALLASWDTAQHAIANHSWQHANFGAPQMSVTAFRQDFLRCDSLIRQYRHYTRFYRFPYLKEGDTREKIDSCRNFLQSENYKMGYVSIDASDWYIDGILKDTLKANPQADITAFRKFYIAHILERSYYYDSLAMALTGRKVKHVLLLHHNLLNALFLNDLIAALKKKHFIFIDAATAYRDPVYRQYPPNVPAGESIIWAMARASGQYGERLRYPAEDGVYEEEKIKQVLLDAAKQ